jgi:hypothetical protein
MLKKNQKSFHYGYLAALLIRISSAFNVAINLSFHWCLAGLCGLTSSDLGKALEEICKDDGRGEDDERDERDERLSEMTEFFNGYHFCRNKKVETVYNTETCLAYLQSIIDGGDLRTKNPSKPDISCGAGGEV